MNRVTTQRHASVIGTALDYLPPRLREMAGADVFCADPVFAGLHSDEETADGRSYRATAHVCYPHHVRDRRVTVVLPERNPAWGTVIHELGHVLDWHLYERAGVWAPTFRPVTEYARRNREEAFAEAFVAWFYPPERGYDGWFAYDAESREFFDALAWQ